MLGIPNQIRQGRSSRRRRLAVPLLPLVVVAAGCGGDDDPARDAAATSTPTTAAEPLAAATAYPLTVEHALGVTTIETEPTSVVAVGGLDAAVANALGAEVVAVPTFMADYPWFEQPIAPDVTVLGYEAVNLEEIASLHPDVILISTAWPIYGQAYDRLSEIAPTIPHLGALLQDDPAELTRMIGAVLGNPGGAEELIERSDGEVDEFTAEHPGLRGRPSPTARSWVRTSTSSASRAPRPPSSWAASGWSHPRRSRPPSGRAPSRGARARSATSRPACSTLPTWSSSPTREMPRTASSPPPSSPTSRSHGPAT
ncbi:MAG: ABC transporter substrate-binding protein [Acidimicrobiia bacterium]|nr:ABC transporter substrate-binding protein [Acidimicrobiia bacterium]